jgi:hypothetical protein
MSSRLFKEFGFFSLQDDGTWLCMLGKKKGNVEYVNETCNSSTFINETPADIHSFKKSDVPSTFFFYFCSCQFLFFPLQTAEKKCSQKAIIQGEQKKECMPKTVTNFFLHFID